jgi:hypothetical protein
MEAKMENKEIKRKQGRPKGIPKTGGKTKGKSLGSVSSLETLDGRLRWLCRLINNDDVEISNKLAAIRLLNDLKGDQAGIQGIPKTVIAIESINKENKHVKELEAMKMNKLKELGLSSNNSENAYINDSEEKMIEVIDKQKELEIKEDTSEIKGEIEGFLDDVDEIPTEKNKEELNNQFEELFKENEGLELSDDDF